MILNTQHYSKGGEKSLGNWTDLLEILPLQEYSSDSGNQDEKIKNVKKAQKLEISILSFNILAESYLTPRSHKNLPDSYANIVFYKEKRRKLLCHVLTKFGKKFDILCLQEVDQALYPVIAECLQQLGFGYIYYPRGSKVGPVLSSDSSHLMKTQTLDGTIKSASKDSRSDGCAIFYKLDKWKCLDIDIVQFDDLADDNRPMCKKKEDPSSSLHEGIHSTKITPGPKQRSAKSALPGIIASYRRVNAAVIIRLESKQFHNHVIIGNAHLYWHPGYEFVKLSQAHYLLYRIQEFSQRYRIQNNVTEKPAVILCGDMNSKPNSLVHEYFTKGSVDARKVAPWYYHYDESEEIQYYESLSGDNNSDQDPIVPIDDDDNNEQDSAMVKNDEDVENFFANLNFCEPCEEDENDALEIHNIKTPTTLPSYDNFFKENDSSSPRYLLDITLNKFTRWLRILGLDAELETKEEEKARTSHGQMLLFEKCRKEKRTLITTSSTLLNRKNCPAGTYLVNPRTIEDLEASLVHLLLLHSITLQPRKFLTRCVVCNGIIQEVSSAEEKKNVFREFGYPGFGEDLDVYKCDKCGQGYWWSDSPQSSASRVKESAGKLLRTCVRGGIPTEGSLDFFNFVNVKEEIKLGEQERSLLQNRHSSGVDEVMSWLQNKSLGHAFKFRSAYASESGETNPFTNVTSDFVGALDYIFFEDTVVQQSGRLFIPTSFSTLNKEKVKNGHLLPSSVWPSDHLAIGAKFTIEIEDTTSLNQDVETEEGKGLTEDSTKNSNKIDQKHLSPKLGCDCGCVPDILSLFEMAELRKQARLKSKTSIR